MSKINKISLVLFLASLIIIDFTITILSLAGEIWFFGTSGFLRFAWLAFIFALIPLSSLIFGIKSAFDFEPFKKNIIVGAIMTPILITVGCFGAFTSSKREYSNLEVINILERRGINIPKSIKSSSFELADGIEINAVILDLNDQKEFKKYVEESDKFYEGHIDGEKYLPFFAIAQTFAFYDYRSLYLNYIRGSNNGSTQTADGYTNGIYEANYIAYSSTLNKIYILADYNITIS